MATVSRYSTASGPLWRVRFRVGSQSTQKRGFKTKREAEQFAASVEVDKSQGTYVAPQVGKVTVGELGEAWLQRQEGHLKPSTFYGYQSRWATHVRPRWGYVRVADVRFSDVQAWVSGMGADRGASTVAAAFGILSRIMADAVRDRIVPSNPCVGVKLPATPPARHVYLSGGQLRRLADEAGPYRGLVLLLGTAGLRWGECAALRPRDVDFLRRRVHLTRNAVRSGGMTNIGTLKSNKSRVVPVAGFVADAVAAACEGKDRDALIWPAQSGGYARPPGEFSWWTYAIERCQQADPVFPRVTAHDLRHTAASLAISAGANVKVVQRMLGHASAAMTLDTYADLFDDDLDAVAVALDARYSQTSPQLGGERK